MEHLKDRARRLEPKRMFTVVELAELVRSPYRLGERALLYTPLLSMSTPEGYPLTWTWSIFVSLFKALFCFPPKHQIVPTLKKNTRALIYVLSGTLPD